MIVPRIGTTFESKTCHYLRLGYMVVEYVLGANTYCSTNTY
jgi:hypothetical protein